MYKLKNERHDNMENEKLILTPKEVQKYLRVGISEVYEKLESGDIPAYRDGRNWKIPFELLKEYIVERARMETERRRKNGSSDC